MKQVNQKHDTSDVTSNSRFRCALVVFALHIAIGPLIGAIAIMPLLGNLTNVFSETWKFLPDIYRLGCVPAAATGAILAYIVSRSGSYSIPVALLVGLITSAAFVIVIVEEHFRSTVVLPLAILIFSVAGAISAMVLRLVLARSGWLQPVSRTGAQN